MRLIRLNAGLPASVVEALGLRDGRNEFDQSLVLQSQVVPVVVLAAIGGAAAPAAAADGDALSSYVKARTAGAVAGQNGIIQLFNPATSGLNLYLDRSTIGPGALGSANQLFWSAALLGGGTELPGENKFVGAGASASRTTVSTSAAAPGTIMDALFTSAAGVSLTLLHAPAIVIPPGFGVHWRSSVANQQFDASLEWREGPA